MSVIVINVYYVMSFTMNTYIVFVTGLVIPIINCAVPHFYSLTLSQPCPRNKYVTRYENGTKRCTKCSRCHKGFKIKRECRTYEDTVCEPCPSGSYSDGIGGNCKPCSVCSPGQYIRRECNAKRDTKCRKCPRGYFTLSGNVTSCLPCKKCRQNENTVEKCDGIKDTKCGECVDDHFRVSSSGSCLRCSECSHKRQDLIVPECLKKLGRQGQNKICWPQTISEEQTFYSVQDIKETIEEAILDDPLEEYTIITDVLPISLAFVLSIFIVLLFVFVIIRFTKCESVIKYVIEKSSKTNTNRPNTHANSDENHYTDEEDITEVERLTNDVTDGVQTDSSECFTDIYSDHLFSNEATTFEDKPEQLNSRHDLFLHV